MGSTWIKTTDSSGHCAFLLNSGFWISSSDQSRCLDKDMSLQMIVFANTQLMLAIGQWAGYLQLFGCRASRY